MKRKQLVTKRSLENLKITVRDFKDDESQLIELSPVGLTFNQDHSRPIVLLKDQQQVNVLPVYISPLEAGITMDQSNLSLASSAPHRILGLLLNNLSIQIGRCVFYEIKATHQYIRVELSGPQPIEPLRVRAEDAMSALLYFGAKFYASPAFVQKSRMMVAELDQQSERLHRPLSEVLPKPGYVM